MANADFHSIAFKRLTKEHRAAIRNTIPEGVRVPLSFWRDLENTLQMFHVQEKNRAKYPPWEERDRWQRIEDLITKTIAELQEADPAMHVGRFGEKRHAILKEGSIRDCREWDAVELVDPMIRTLNDFKERSGQAVIGYDILATGYRGWAKPHREKLYADIVELWTRKLDLEPGFNRPPPPGGPPYGAIIDFFCACVAPVLGNASPPVETVAEIIVRHRDRINAGLPLRFEERKRKATLGLEL